PIDTALTVVPAGNGVRILDGERLVAEARPAELELELELPQPVSYAAAVRLAEGRPDETDHPFPSCFTCGPGRVEGDALRLRTTPTGGGRVAAAWRPPAALPGDGPLPPELVRAPLDCP